MEFDINNLDKSIFTFEWKNFEKNKCHPYVPYDFKIDIQYKDENGNSKKEKATLNDFRKPEFISSKKDLKFYQPYISNEYIKSKRVKIDFYQTDISSYQLLLNSLREAYKIASEGGTFEYTNDNYSKKAFTCSYHVNFKAKLGQAILFVNIGNTFSECFKEHELIEIDSIKKLDETLRIIKRRIPFLNQKLDELKKEYDKVARFPVFKNGEERLKEKLSSIIGFANSNVRAADEVYKFLSSDEFKSFLKS